MNITELTNEELARLYFRKLWQRYSASGINMRRSFQAHLLEGYTDLISGPHIPNLDQFGGVEDICKEVSQRTIQVDRSQLLFTDYVFAPEFLDREGIAYLCLTGLLWWYQEIDAKTEWPLQWERMHVEAACSLLPLPKASIGLTRKDWVAIGNLAYARVREIALSEFSTTLIE